MATNGTLYTVVLIDTNSLKLVWFFKLVLQYDYTIVYNSLGNNSTVSTVYILNKNTLGIQSARPIRSSIVNG